MNLKTTNLKTTNLETTNLETAIQKPVILKTRWVVKTTRFIPQITYCAC